MKIKAKVNTQATGGVPITEGKTYTAPGDLSERDARYLVSIGKAVGVSDKKPADKKPADKKPADKKPADKKPADKKPADKE